MRRLLYIVLLVLMLSCSTSKQIIEVPVETVRTEYIHDIRIDSIHVKDSIDRWRSGDTVFIYKGHTEYKYQNKTDTVIKVDSIPIIMNTETIKEVEVNHIKWYQKLFMWIGIITLISSLSFIFYKIKSK